jgi:hypothetical protein
LPKEMLPPPLSLNIDEVEINVQQAWQLSADVSDQYPEIHLSMRQHCVLEVVICGTSCLLWFFFHLKGMSNQLDFIERCYMYQILVWDLSHLQNWNLYHLLCIKALNIMFTCILWIQEIIGWTLGTLIQCMFNYMYKVNSLS